MTCPECDGSGRVSAGPPVTAEDHNYAALGIRRLRQCPLCGGSGRTRNEVRESEAGKGSNVFLKLGWTLLFGWGVLVALNWMGYTGHEKARNVPAGRTLPIDGDWEWKEGNVSVQVRASNGRIYLVSNETVLVKNLKPVSPSEYQGEIAMNYPVLGWFRSYRPVQLHVVSETELKLDIRWDPQNDAKGFSATLVRFGDSHQGPR